MGLDTVEFVLEAEKHFGVSISDEAAAKTETVGQFVQLIYDLRDKTSKPLAHDEVCRQVQSIIVEQFAIPVEKIVLTARFIEDLGLD